MLISYYANKKSSPRLPSWQPSLIFFNIPIESGSIIKPCTLKHFQVTYRLHKAGYWTIVSTIAKYHHIRRFQAIIFTYNFNKKGNTQSVRSITLQIAKSRSLCEMLILIKLSLPGIKSDIYQYLLVFHWIMPANYNNFVEKCCSGSSGIITLGAVSIRKTVLPGMAIPMLKIRRPNGRLIFNMEIVIRR